MGKGEKGKEEIEIPFPPFPFFPHYTMWPLDNGRSHRNRTKSPPCNLTSGCRV